MARALLPSRGMKTLLAIATLCSGCSLYFGSSDDSDDQPPPPDRALHQLTAVRHVGAEGAIVGLDADGEGKVWIAYSETTTSGFYDPKLVTLVHWDPTTRTRLAEFTYEDQYTPVHGLALVQGQIWLNYHPAGPGNLMIRVIDPTSGAILRTLGSTPGTIEMSPLGADKALLSDQYNDVITVDIATGGYLQTFHTGSFTTTQTGIAWRPGEIWVSSWYDREIEVFNEAGLGVGKVPLPDIPSSVAANYLPILAFDRGELLVGYGSQLTWFAVD